MVTGVERDLSRLTEREHDVLVVGGGISGVTAAWDAAERGLKTALVEADDFGAGVSWNSLKTIHGGLRHLQRADIASLRESVRERRAILRIAPQIVRPLTFLVPIYGHGLKGREAMGLGLAAYDALSWDRNDGLLEDLRIPRSRLLSPSEVCERLPEIPKNGLTGGALWTDAQVELNERLVMGFVCAAAAAGAVVANRVEVTDLLLRQGQVCGIRARDKETGAALQARSRMVINAAGAGLDRVTAMAGIRAQPIPLLRATNLVLSRAPVAGQAVGVSSEGRFLFIVPWRDRAMVGTEYVPAERPLTSEEASAFGQAAARAFPWAELRPENVTLIHRGSVPGRRDGHGLWTRSRVIDHQEEDGVAGLVSILAVKYTTARGLAEIAVDRVGARLGRRLPPCRTAATPLVEARPLLGSIEEQTQYAVEHEMARTLADVVCRRIGLGTAGPPAPEALEAVVGSMKRLLGWDVMREEEEKRMLLGLYPENRPEKPANRRTIGGSV